MSTPRTTTSLDVARARAYIDTLWHDSITPTLVEYVRIPNKSPSFQRRMRSRMNAARRAV